MRKEGFYGKRIAITVRYSDFFTFSKQKTLSKWVNSGNEIFKLSSEIFESIPHPKPIRLLGSRGFLIEKRVVSIGSF